MEMVVQSKILNKVLTSILRRTVKKKLKEDCEVDVRYLKLDCNDDVTNVVVTVKASISTEKIPELLKKFDVL